MKVTNLFQVRWQDGFEFHTVGEQDDALTMERLLRGAAGVVTPDSCQIETHEADEGRLMVGLLKCGVEVGPENKRRPSSYIHVIGATAAGSWRRDAAARFSAVFHVLYGPDIHARANDIANDALIRPYSKGKVMHAPHVATVAILGLTEDDLVENRPKPSLPPMKEASVTAYGVNLNFVVPAILVTWVALGWLFFHLPQSQAPLDDRAGIILDNLGKNYEDLRSADLRIQALESRLVTLATKEDLAVVEDLSERVAGLTLASQYLWSTLYGQRLPLQALQRKQRQKPPSVATTSVDKRLTTLENLIKGTSSEFNLLRVGGGKQVEALEKRLDGIEMELGELRLRLDTLKDQQVAP